MITRFRDIADIHSGFPFRGRVENDPAGELAVVTMRDIEPGKPLRESDLIRVSQTADGQIKVSEKDVMKYDPDRHLLRIGDVVFQSRGFHNHAAVVDQPFHGLAALGLYRIRPHSERVDSAYLTWCLNQKRFQYQIRALSQGTQIPFIPRSELARVNIPLPSLEIQRQIAAINDLSNARRTLQEQLGDLTDRLLWHSANSTDFNNSTT